MTSSSFRASRQLEKKLLWFLSFLILCRILLMIAAPETDTSESRYAEIARKMVETGNWITPQFNYGVPFWAKPPLAMWLSALGIRCFGVNEFGSRVFIFLAALGVLAMVWQTGRREFKGSGGLLAATMLMAMPLFFYCSAAVMTDLALVLGTTMAMTGFRRAVTDASRLHGYLFFTGLALGLLAKGPLALVLAIVPVCAWVLITGRWNSLRSLPWIGGTLLMMSIAAPWYLLAEQRTPGFLNYFIMGEHWKRFTVRGWKGDMYGNAHAVPPGAVWAYWLFAAFPWAFGFLAIPWRRWRELGAWARAEDGLGIYLLCWAIWPVAFFTPARNVIATYPLPALPATALLLAETYLKRDEWGRWWRPHPLHPLLISSSLLISAWALAVTFVWPDSSPKHSERELIHRYQRERRPEDRIVCYGPRRYSAEFYMRGSVAFATSPSEIEAELSSSGRLFFIAPTAYVKSLPTSLIQRFRELGRAGRETLYVSLPQHATPTATVEK